MIIDGRALAGEVLTRAKTRAAHLAHPPRVLAIVASQTSATKSYLGIKEKRAADAGCILEVQQFLESVSVEELQSAITTSDADAIIVQLPLPAGIDAKAMCDSIPLSKDADVLSTMARTAFEHTEGALLPPVVGAIAEIFHVHNVELKGKPPFAKGYGGAMKAVVIGNGFLVGAPVAIWLRKQGADVSVLTSQSGDLTASLRTADIIVSGAGSPYLIKPEMIKEGVVLIDAGTSESNGAIAGDADPACVTRCSLFTPVPGGIGPLAVAYLFENVVTLAERGY